LALLQRSVWYAESQARDQSALRQRIRDIAMSRPRFGYLRVLVMLKREGRAVGKPTDNGLIESFNGRLRDEFLNVNEFVTMYDAREKLRAWQEDYNTRRPLGSLGHLTPSEFVKMRSGQPVEAANL
jgi:transposase InsO family protein